MMIDDDDDDDDDYITLVLTQQSFVCLHLFYCPPQQQSHSFFKLLSMLTEMQGGPPGMPSFTNLTLARIWEVRVVAITCQFC